jgi:uncharacterized OsmC-like protein
MSNLNFSIKGVSINATKLTSQARGFTFIVDEPPELGGNDEGPNPVEYLLGSYAGCFNVVLNIVAKEMGITITYLKIDVDGDIDPSKLIGGFSLNRAGFQSINITVHIKTNASETENRELIKLAKERCPINDNLKNPTPINYSIH